MSNDYTSLVSKVWNYAHVLKGSGVHYGAYVEQITYLLFLKMDDERAELLGLPSEVPPKWHWENLVAGKVLNQIKVPADVAEQARTALDRMLAVTA